MRRVGSLVGPAIFLPTRCGYSIELPLCWLCPTGDASPSAVVACARAAVEDVACAQAKLANRRAAREERRVRLATRCAPHSIERKGLDVSSCASLADLRQVIRGLV